MMCRPKPNGLGWHRGALFGATYYVLSQCIFILPQCNFIKINRLNAHFYTILLVFALQTKMSKSTVIMPNKGWHYLQRNYGYY